MTKELYNPTVPKVYWWRSRAFRISLAIFVGLAVIAVVLFNQQIGNLFKSFGSKAANDRTITLTGGTPASADEHSFFEGDDSATPFADSFKIENGRLMLKPGAPTAASGLVLGDSTVATTYEGIQIVDFLYTTTEINSGWRVTSIAKGGDTITKQKVAYLSTGKRSTVDYTLVQIGLNDLKWDEPSSPAIARLQNLVDTINTNKKSGSFTIISTMTPNRQRLINAYGEANGVISYQKYLDINNAIKGSGPTPITGVDYRISEHTALLDDGQGNLAAQYETTHNDHVHENNVARQIIAGEWRKALVELGLL